MTHVNTNCIAKVLYVNASTKYTNISFEISCYLGMLQTMAKTMVQGRRYFLIRNCDSGLTMAKYLSRVTDIVKYTDPVLDQNIKTFFCRNQRPKLAARFQCRILGTCVVMSLGEQPLNHWSKSSCNLKGRQLWQNSFIVSVPRHSDHAVDNWDQVH